jgi:hypothetical protein
MIIVSVGFLLMLGLAEEALCECSLLPAIPICLGLGMGTAYPIYTIGSASGVEEERHGVRRRHPEHGAAITSWLSVRSEPGFLK